MFINSGCILQYRQSGYGKWLSLKVTPPSGSAITCYLASQPSSVTGDDIWMSTGRSTLAVTDMTTKKWGAKWVTVSSLLYLPRYGDFFFSFKEP